MAFVTGGARRLGRQIAYFLADEGYDLAINYNSSPKKELVKVSAYLKSKNTRFKFYKCDLTDIKSLRQAVNRIAKDFGRIDLLINNAGIIRRIRFEDITEKIYDNILDVNLKGMFFTCQFCLPLLKKSDNPNIINLASLGGIKNWVNYFPYCISKAGVIKLTYLLAKALAPEIRVNAIAPGTIIIEGEERGITKHVALKSIPLKKYGTSKDIIEAVRFLINCKYITGQIIVLDGGRTAV